MARGANVYAVSRAIWEDPDFADEPFTEREAWLWLVGAAAWKQIKTRGNAGAVTLERGEFSFSLIFLAKRFQWERGRVERFLIKLKKRDTIRDGNRDGCKIYSINNYNRFQVVAMPKRDEVETIGETLSGRDRDKEETGETVKQSPSEIARELEAVPKPNSPKSLSLRKPTRWPPDAVVPDDWIQAAGMRRVQDGSPPIDLAYEARRFQNYWAAKSGGGATKVDWRLTWMNWATDKEKTNGRQSGRPPSANDKFVAGGRAFLASLGEPEWDRPSEGSAN